MDDISVIIEGEDATRTNHHVLGAMEDGGQTYHFSFDDVNVGSISYVYLISHGDDSLCVDSIDVNNAFEWDPFVNECFSYTANNAEGCEVVQFWDDDNEVQFTEEPCQIIPPPTPLPTAVTSHPTRNPSIAPSTYSPSFTPTTITLSPSRPPTLPTSTPSLFPSLVPSYQPSNLPTQIATYSGSIDVA